MKLRYLFIASILSCSCAFASTPVYLDLNAPIEERVADALSRMTLEEKLALSHAQSKFSSPGVRRLGIPELWMSDGPHGVLMEINWNDWGHSGWTSDAVTAFPALTALAATWNPEPSYLYGKSLGEEARYREKDVMLGPGVNIYRTLANPYLDMIKKGEVSDSIVNAKAANVRRLIFRTAMNVDKPFGSVASPEHYDAAKKIGDEAIVLLKNNGLLPLDAVIYKKILVVGENTVRPLNEGGGSSELKVQDMFSPLEALRSVFGVVDYQPGYKSGRARDNKEDVIAQSVQDSLADEAVKTAGGYDALIYIGGINKNGFQDSESTDRREYNLPWGQDKLIERLVDANPKTIVANITGNAYAMPWLDKVPSVIQSCYLGTMIGPSMADVITGKVNLSGKLPFSFPKRLLDNDAHHFGEVSYPGIEEAQDIQYQEYMDDILVGYRWHDTKKISPLFPFGHGLSYTSFKYGKPAVSSRNISASNSVLISVPVTNDGLMEGSETVQLYIGDDKASVLRPIKELKHFKKIALKPGETKVVEFEVSNDDLKFFDDRSHDWIAEPGGFKALVGSSAGDIRHTIAFTLEK